MLLPKTISQDGIQTLSNGRYEPGPADSLYAREVIDLDPVVVEEKPSRSMSTVPRPVLPSRVATIGNYLPRKCGIATFTTDLCDAIHAEYRAIELLALPVNDTAEGYRYPTRVRFELSQDSLATGTKVGSRSICHPSTPSISTITPRSYGASRIRALRMFRN
jgi:hypothetical protein